MARHTGFGSVGLLLAGSLALAVSTASAAQRTKSQQVQDALDQLTTMDTVGLAEVREMCARNIAVGLKAQQEARGNGFPEVHRYCRAAIDAAAPRNLSQELYVNLALQELYGKWDALTAEDFALAAKGDGGKLAVAIAKAAGQGQTAYVGLSGREYGLTPALAYDVGHYVGQMQPEKVPSVADPAELEQGAASCFDPAVSAIVLNGEPTSPTRACMIIGANFGKRLARPTG